MGCGLSYDGTFRTAPVELTLLSLSGLTVAIVSAQRSWTLQQVKQACQQQTPGKYVQDVIYQNKTLDADRTVDELRIPTGAFLHVIFGSRLTCVIGRFFAPSILAAGRATYDSWIDIKEDGTARMLICRPHVLQGRREFRALGLRCECEDFSSADSSHKFTLTVVEVMFCHGNLRHKKEYFAELRGEGTAEEELHVKGIASVLRRSRDCKRERPVSELELDRLYRAWTMPCRDSTSSRML